MGASEDSNDRTVGHWCSVMRATWLLAAAWGVAAVLVPWWARHVGGTAFGFPFGYWLAAQGALLVFLVIVVVCVVWMERLEAGCPPAPEPKSPKDVVR